MFLQMNYIPQPFAHYHSLKMLRICNTNVSIWIKISSLNIIFNESLESSEIPDEWKKGKITAFFKKGSKKVASNYRPVSLTSIVC